MSALLSIACLSGAASGAEPPGRLITAREMAMLAFGRVQADLADARSGCLVRALAGFHDRLIEVVLARFRIDGSCAGGLLDAAVAAKMLDPDRALPLSIEFAGRGRAQAFRADPDNPADPVDALLAWLARPEPGPDDACLAAAVAGDPDLAARRDRLAGLLGYLIPPASGPASDRPLAIRHAFCDGPLARTLHPAVPGRHATTAAQFAGMLENDCEPFVDEEAVHPGAVAGCREAAVLLARAVVGPAAAAAPLLALESGLPPLPVAGWQACRLPDGDGGTAGPVAVEYLPGLSDRLAGWLDRFAEAYHDVCGGVPAGATALAGLLKQAAAGEGYLRQLPVGPSALAGPRMALFARAGRLDAGGRQYTFVSAVVPAGSPARIDGGAGPWLIRPVELREWMVEGPVDCRSVVDGLTGGGAVR